MSVSKSKALLIACTALNPFVTFDLLRRVGQKVEPIPGAEEIGIKDVLAQLHMQDQKFNLHTIEFILDTIVSLCRKEGFGIALGVSDLVSGRFETIRDLRDEIVRST